jgi:hypothetical protein
MTIGRSKCPKKKPLTVMFKKLTVMCKVPRGT